jgi:2-polyprenyl-6-methoxyphenol hydroxylase-like FAD-dependent oxidoreductase
MSELRVLIVGGGIGGMAAAIKLKAQGLDVDLIDLDPHWRVYGAGITITGPTLRAYRHLGLLEDIQQQGAITVGSRIYLYDGTFLKEMDQPVLEAGLPGNAGIMRPVLHQIMQRRISALDVPVRLGITVDRLDQDGKGVDVTFSDGAAGRYDIVVGADSINSRVRSLAFPDAQAPVPTGQGCWRISMNRPPAFEGAEFYFGHRHPAGITTCGADSIYMWMLTPDDGSLRVKDDEGYDLLKALLQDFGGTIGWIRDNMRREHWVNYRPLAAVLQPGPWVNGRIALLGDSAHATTPHLASGAGMAVEGGVVLGEELAVPGRGVEAALMAYNDRRYPRCRHVVESSVAIGKAQLEGASPDAVGAMIGAALHKLAQPF